MTSEEFRAQGLESATAKVEKAAANSPFSMLHSQLKEDAVILADGDFPTADVPLRILREARFIVCCDGAARHADQLPATSEIGFIGDGDSIPDALRPRLHQVAEQEDNDLTKATRFCLSRGCRRIAYLGCTGRREDHTLGNIALLMRYRRDFAIEPMMLTDYGYVTTAEGDATFDSFAGQQVSLFNFGCQRLESTGLKWQAYPYAELWQGTLNEALTTQFTIRADGPYLVYRTYAAHS